MSYERLQLNLLTLFDGDVMGDMTLFVQGRDIRCHKAILAAQSTKFKKLFMEQAGQNRVQLDNVSHKVMFTLVRFMYFGGVAAAAGAELGPEDGLDMLLLSEEYGISALDQADIMPLILPKLTIQNCLHVLQHGGLPKYPVLQAGICEFVGTHFLTMLDTVPEQLMTIPPAYLPGILRGACRHVATPRDAQRVVQFSLQIKQLDSACDLLRETKSWDWGSTEATMLRAINKEEEPQESPEWRLVNVRAAMESTPARICVGNFFDWCIRLDYGAEGKLRIVYESATPRESTDGQPRSINRFPAAMFAWRVLYRGQDVFNEKPVFICFPENVSLHWSTTLPVTASDLSDDDTLQIMVNMAENPMLSLVLYYFSSDLKTTVSSEDILNRLPHIEYRCLSSYSLVKTHMEEPAK